MMKLLRVRNGSAEYMSKLFDDASSIDQLRVLEFYSGIGGMHYALKECAPHAKIMSAFDINTTANSIYSFNFPTTNLGQNNIEALDVKFLDDTNADLWTMSPPCQPFTQKGLKLGAQDRRCDSLKALLDKLKKLTKPPRFIFLENVVGFESTSVHRDVTETLQSCCYTMEEFIISPSDVGIPNTRPRYFLLAKLVGQEPVPYVLQIKKSPELGRDFEPLPMTNFLTLDLDESDSKLLVDEKTLAKYGEALDVISPLSTRSACFTKSYGTYISGCGSYFVKDDAQISNNHLRDASSAKGVRRLTPREMANLMCFPPEFSWPETTTYKQLYRTLGNSVNVQVVSILLRRLLNSC